MAREKARALGLNARRPSALEQAAAQLEREQQDRSRRAEDERPTISRQAEVPPFSLQRVSLQVNGSGKEDDVGWKVYTQPERKGKGRPRKIGHIPVMSMAQRAIWGERASARGSSRVIADPRARALEQATRRWEEEERTKTGIPGGKR